MVTTEELCVWCQRLHLLQERPAGRQRDLPVP